MNWQLEKLLFCNNGSTAVRAKAIFRTHWNEKEICFMARNEKVEVVDERNESTELDEKCAHISWRRKKYDCSSTRFLLFARFFSKLWDRFKENHEFLQSKRFWLVKASVRWSLSDKIDGILYACESILCLFYSHNRLFRWMCQNVCERNDSI